MEFFSGKAELLQSSSRRWPSNKKSDDRIQERFQKGGDLRHEQSGQRVSAIGCRV
jgi:hypothetical protein